LSDLHDFLEDFGQLVQSSTAPQASAPGVSEVDLEGQKLEAFEKGYRAGWDDAVTAQTDEATRVSSAFGQHLQDLSFTYHEAYGQVMSAVTPLLTEMVETFLPEVVRATLGQHIAEQLQKRAQEIGQLEVEVAVAPSRLEAVAPLLEGGFGFPLRLVPDDTLADDQADIRFGDQERQIDLGDLIASVSEAVQGFAHDNERIRDHG
jgi:flagellar biosynthesis/type III secretory pathway protein FliH